MCVRICGWCKRVLGYVQPYEDPRATHTICCACKEKHSPKTKEVMSVL